MSFDPHLYIDFLRLRMSRLVGGSRRELNHLRVEKKERRRELNHLRVEEKEPSQELRTSPRVSGASRGCISTGLVPA